MCLNTVYRRGLIRSSTVCDFRFCSTTVLSFFSFGRVFPGTAAFQLYSSMGFPLDLLTLMAEEKVRVDHDSVEDNEVVWR